MKQSIATTELSDGATVSRQAIAKHLQVLEGAGLVTHHKQGREVRYALETQRLDQARGFIESVSAHCEHALDRLRHMVEETPARMRKGQKKR